MAERLRKLRGSKPVQEIEKDTGITRQTISKYESLSLPPKQPTFEIVAALADYYNVDMEYLVNEEFTAKTYDVKFIMQYTGLSEASIEYLHDLQPDQIQVLNDILNHGSGLDSIIDHAQRRAILPQRIKRTEKTVNMQLKMLPRPSKDGELINAPGHRAEHKASVERIELEREINKMALNVNAAAGMRAEFRTLKEDILQKVRAMLDSQTQPPESTIAPDIIEQAEAKKDIYINAISEIYPEQPEKLYPIDELP